MRSSTITPTIAATFSLMSFATACTPGVSCIALYTSNDCNGGSSYNAPGGDEVNYKPTTGCNAGCYQYSSFDSVWISATTTQKTSCTIYSDNNCEYEIGSGSTEDTACLNSFSGQQGNSLKCTWMC